MRRISSEWSFRKSNIFQPPAASPQARIKNLFPINFFIFAPVFASCQAVNVVSMLLNVKKCCFAPAASRLNKKTARWRLGAIVPGEHPYRRVGGEERAGAQPRRRSAASLGWPRERGAVRELSRHVGHAAVGMGPHPRARASRHLSYGTLARRSTTLALRPGITYRCWPASQAPYATALPSRTGCCPSVQTIAATSES
jgi:hypothetical protein